MTQLVIGLVIGLVLGSVLGVMAMALIVGGKR